MSKDRYALSFPEMTTVRTFFHKHAEEYITKEFQMRTILSEMGQYPPSTEIGYVLEAFGGKVSFNNFCNYCCYLKKKYSKPEPKDVDTLRAFVALGGGGDRTGDISTEDLRQTCKHFQLTIDIDAMIKEVDEDGSGTVDYSEFQSMWVVVQELEDDDVEPGHHLPMVRKASMKMEEEVTLDDEENLQAVRQFLFPLERKGTAPDINAASKRKSVRGKSVVRLPPLGGLSKKEKADVFESFGEMTREEDSKAGLKPIAPVHPHTARASVAAFVPPSPTILDFRGRSHKKNTSSPHHTPRKPISARGPVKRSRLY
jgi:Ca2+-binding EF-hand superfamily protein